MPAYPGDLTIDQLPPHGPPKDADLLPLWANEKLVQITILELLTRVAQGVPTPPTVPNYITLTRTTDAVIGTGLAAVPWQAATGPLASLWNPATPTGIAVPAGFTYARATFNANFPNANVNTYVVADISCQGQFPPGVSRCNMDQNTTGSTINHASGATGWFIPPAGTLIEMRAAAGLASVQKIRANAFSSLNIEFA